MKREGREKVVCIFWCEVSVYYICTDLYFSCRTPVKKNADIDQCVNNCCIVDVVMWNSLPGLAKVKVQSEPIILYSDCNCLNRQPFNEKV